MGLFTYTCILLFYSNKYIYCLSIVFVLFLRNHKKSQNKIESKKNVTNPINVIILKLIHNYYSKI